MVGCRPGLVCLPLPGVLSGDRIQPVFFSLWLVKMRGSTKDPRLAVQLETPACTILCCLNTPAQAGEAKCGDLERNGDQRKSGAGQELRGMPALRDCLQGVPTCSLKAAPWTEKLKKERASKKGQMAFLPPPLKTSTHHGP